MRTPCGHRDGIAQEGLRGLRDDAGLRSLRKNVRRKFYRLLTADLPPIQRCAAGGCFTLEVSVHIWPPSAAGGAGVHRRRCRCSPTGAKGARTPNGFLAPLDTPNLPLDATPFGCASKRGLRGLGSGRVLAYVKLRCPEFPLRGWQRCQCAASRCRAAAFRCEKLRFHQGCTLGAPNAPVGPSHFAARPQGVAARRKVRGVKRGQETMLGVLSPFAPAGGYR